MKLKPNSLPAHLKKNLAPCYLVSGDEPLQVDECLDAIRGAARARGFSTREVQVADSGFDWRQLSASGANLSLFGDRRLVELRLPTGKPGREGSQAIVDFVAALDDDVLFVVVTPKLDSSGANSRWARALDETGASVVVWPVDRRELPGWVAARMRRAGLLPEPDAVDMIAERVEGNLLAAAQEVEKLRLLLGEGPVTADDIRKVVADSSRYDIYKLADAALEGDARRSLRIVAGLRAEGIEPVLVVWALLRDLRTLALLADELERRSDLGSAMQKQRVWRNRQDLMRAALRRNSRGTLLGLLRRAGRADAAAKGQSADDPWQLVTGLVVDLAVGGRRAA